MGVQPKGNPGHDHKHATGDVDGEQVVGKLTLERQVHRQATVGAWKESCKSLQYVSTSYSLVNHPVTDLAYVNVLSLNKIKPKF